MKRTIMLLAILSLLLTLFSPAVLADVIYEPIDIIRDSPLLSPIVIIIIVAALVVATLLIIRKLKK